LANNESLQKTYLRRNLLFFVLFEFIWGFGMPLVYNATVMSAMLLTLSGSESSVGIMQTMVLLPVMFIVIPRIKLFSNIPRKKLMWLLYMAYSSGFCVIGLILLFFSHMPVFSLILIFAVYFLVNGFCNCGNIIHKEYTLDLIPSKYFGRLQGVLSLSNSITAVLGSLFALWLLKDETLINFAYAYITAGVIFIVSTLSVFVSKDIPKGTPLAYYPSVAFYAKKALLPVLRPRINKYVIGIITALQFITLPYAFFIVFYQKELGIDISIATINVVVFISRALLTPVFGFLFDKLSRLKTMYVFSSIVIICFVSMIMYAGALWWAVFIVFGMIASFVNMATLSILNEFNEGAGRFDLLAAATVISFISGAGLSFIYGYMIEYWGLYRIIFVFSVLLCILVCLLLKLYDKARLAIAES